MAAGSGVRTDLYAEEAGSGAAIVLVPPAGATSQTWGPFADQLSEHARVIRYDRRGYGRTGGPAATSIAEHTHDLIELVDRLNAAPVVAVGISVGATIAIDLARLRPDLVRAAVAHEAPWHATRRPPTLAEVKALTTMAVQARRGRAEQAVTTFLTFAYTDRLGRNSWDLLPEQWRATARAHAQPALSDVRIAVGGYPTKRQLGSVRVPVLCTYGQRSPRKMVRLTRGLSRVIPTAALAEVAGAGHAVAFDAPEAFTHVVLTAASTATSAAD